MPTDTVNTNGFSPGGPGDPPISPAGAQQQSPMYNHPPVAPSNVNNHQQPGQVQLGQRQISQQQPAQQQVGQQPPGLLPFGPNIINHGQRFAQQLPAQQQPGQLTAASYTIVTPGAGIQQRQAQPGQAPPGQFAQQQPAQQQPGQLAAASYAVAPPGASLHQQQAQPGQMPPGRYPDIAPTAAAQQQQQQVGQVQMGRYPDIAPAAADGRQQKSQNGVNGTNQMMTSMQTAASDSASSALAWTPSMTAMPPSVIAVLPSQHELDPLPTDAPPDPALPRTPPMQHTDPEQHPPPPKHKKGCCSCSCFGCGHKKDDLDSFLPGRGRRAISEALSALRWSMRFHGPYLRFVGYDTATRMWSGSVMLVVNQSKSPMPPTLYYQDQGSQDETVTVRLKNAATGGIQAITSKLKKLAPKRVDTYNEWTFWRFDLKIQCGPKQRKIRYFPYVPTEVAVLHRPHKHYTFMLPPAEQAWHWGFYSCNGFDNPEEDRKLGGIQPLWRDIMSQHHQKPFHLMVGGGDQLYNDGVWKLPVLVNWCKMPNIKDRVEHQFTPEMQQEVTKWYFKAYITHWGQEMFADALAAIPQIMVWDDHDIFDGWGSYPADLHQCPVFQGVYQVARRWYAAFQLHSTPEGATMDNNYFGEMGWNLLTNIGPTTALLLTDSRTGRSTEQIMHPNTYPMIKAQLEALPPSTRHVVVVTTVPVAYPQIPGMEAALKMMSGEKASNFSMAQLLTKTGLAGEMINRFGTIEILDDLMDHWGSPSHLEEKKGFIELLQGVAQQKGFRITLMSGDVHVAALGAFASKEKIEPRLDYRYMPQVISSAIGHVPPPPSVVTVLNKVAGVSNLNEETQEYMIELFGDKVYLLGQRNWLNVNENPMVPNDTSEANGALLCQYRVEPPHKHLALHIVNYEVAIPPLHRAQ